MTTPTRRAAALCALLATSCLATPAFGQMSEIAKEYRNYDDNGVDLTDGTYRFSVLAGAIGAGDGAITLANTNGTSDNWMIGFRRVQSATVATITLAIADRTETFTGATTATSFTDKMGNGATLTKATDGSYVYTDAAGTVTKFVNPNTATDPGSFCATGYESNCQMLAQTTVAKSGMTTTYNYTSVNTCVWEVDQHVCTSFYRLNWATNSAGYKISFSYVDSTIPGYGPPSADWHKRSGATLSNTKVVGSRSISFAYPTASVTDITDMGGRVWKITRNSTGKVIGVRRPGSTSDDIVVTHGTGGVTKVVKDGVTTDYSRVVTGATSTVAGTATMTISNAATSTTAARTSTIVSDLSIGRPTSIKNPLGHTTTLQYDAKGRIERVHQPETNYVRYTYDARGNVTETRQFPKSGSSLSQIVTKADFPDTCTNTATCNKPITTTDERGHVTNYEYNATHGGITRVLAPAPAAGGFQLDSHYYYGVVNGVTMPTAIITCQTTEVCGGTADASETHIGYDANLLPTTITRKNGNETLSATTTLDYDYMGDLVSHDGPIGYDITLFRYNAARQRTATIMPDHDATGGNWRRAEKITYGADGQASKVETGTVEGATDTQLAAMNVRETADIAYDGNSRKSRETLTADGAAQAMVHYRYDGLGRLICTAQRMSPETYTTYTGDACNKGLGSGGYDRVVRNYYDLADQLTQVNTGSAHVDVRAAVRRTYTDNGLVASEMDGEDNKTDYAYDSHDRLSTITYPPVSTGLGRSVEQFTYIAGSNLVDKKKLRYGDAYLDFSYDNLGRVIAKDPSRTGEPTIVYSYDNVGRLRSTSRKDPSTGALSQTYGFGYDALGRNTSQSGPLGTATFSYDAADRRIQMVYPGGGLTLNYTYWFAGPLRAILQDNGDNADTGLVNFYYDGMGRRTLTSPYTNADTSCAYDGLSRLKTLTHGFDGTAYDTSSTFTYTPAHEIKTVTRSNDIYAFTELYNVSNRTYTTNPLNQYTDITTASTARTLAYDGNGNLTQLKLTSTGAATGWGYDPENRLTSETTTAAGSTTATPSAALAYDPLGRLYAITDQAPATDVTTRFAYDNGQIIAEYSSPTDVARRYVHVPGSADEPIVWYEGAGLTDKRFLHADERGSIVAISNNVGGVIATNSYDEYGVPASTNTGRFQYTGQAWLPELQLYYYKARMYSPTLGRFMQTDPIGYADGMNMYAYGGGEPINRTDPRGTEWWPSRLERKQDEWGRSFWGSSSGGSSSGGLRDVDGNWRVSELGKWQELFIRRSWGDDVVGYEYTGGGASFDSGGFGGIMQNISFSGDVAEFGSNLLDNLARGRAGEATAVTLISEMGYTILGQQVYVSTPYGLRITDIVARGPNGLTGFEVKTGLNAYYSPLQRLKDTYIDSTGGTLVSRGGLGSNLQYGDHIRYHTLWVTIIDGGY